MYNEVRNKIKTGDVISFSGKGHTSNIIKEVTDSDISHVGIVLKKTIVENQERILLIESTTLNKLPDVFTGKKFKGVQVQYLSDRIKDYKGQVYWHGLQRTLKPMEKQALITFLMLQHQLEYDSKQAIGAGVDIFDILFSNIENHDEFFCSELVAAAYKHIGWFPGSYNTSEITPADVVEYSFLNKRVQIG